MFEAATFNGDEPEGPGDWPDAARFGDSWAVRASVAPTPTLELQASFASVVSPEDAQGFGLNQRKRSASLRWESPLSYALVEYAETDEYARTRLTYTFWSALAEAQQVLGPVTLAARIERTVRPEEERTIDDFRSVRPLLDFNILGRTRWDLVSISASANVASLRRVRIVPFGEVMYGRPSATRRNPIFDPKVFYGASGVWSFTAGARMHIGTMRSRMGRYGPRLPGRQAWRTEAGLQTGMPASRCVPALSTLAGHTLR